MNEKEMTGRSVPTADEVARALAQVVRLPAAAQTLDLRYDMEWTRLSKMIPVDRWAPAVVELWRTGHLDFTRHRAMMTIGVDLTGLGNLAILSWELYSRMVADSVAMLAARGVNMTQNTRDLAQGGLARRLTHERLPLLVQFVACFDPKGPGPEI